jgi:hypothetical protein
MSKKTRTCHLHSYDVFYEEDSCPICEMESRNTELQDALRRIALNAKTAQRVGLRKKERATALAEIQKAAKQFGRP